MTTASPLLRYFIAHSRHLPILTRRGCITHSCLAFIPPATTYSLWMSSAMYLSMALVFSPVFMLDSFIDEWSVDFWVGVATTDSGFTCTALRLVQCRCGMTCHPRLGSAGSPNNAAGFGILRHPIVAVGLPRR